MDLSVNYGWTEFHLEFKMSVYVALICHVITSVREEESSVKEKVCLEEQQDESILIPIESLVKRRGMLGRGDCRYDITLQLIILYCVKVYPNRK